MYPFEVLLGLMFLFWGAAYMGDLYEETAQDCME